MSLQPAGKVFSPKVRHEGFLRSSDFRSVAPRFRPENLDANQVLVHLVKEIATEKSATPLRSLWHGCWLKNRGSFPFRNHPKAAPGGDLGAVDIDLTAGVAGPE